MDAGFSGSGYEVSSGLDDPPARPLLAFGLSLIAGFLIVIDGLLVLWAASAVSTVAVGPVASAAASLLGLFGGLALLFGMIVGILAVSLLARPESHAVIGVTILVFSLLSFVVGGGFYIGGILGVIAGILAIVFEADDDIRPLPSLTSRPRSLEGVMNAPPPTSRSTLGGAQSRFARSREGDLVDSSERPNIGCPSCGEIQPAARAVHCRKCGAELRHGPASSPH